MGHGIVLGYDVEGDDMAGDDMAGDDAVALGADAALLLGLDNQMVLGGRRGRRAVARAPRFQTAPQPQEQTQVLPFPVSSTGALIGAGLSDTVQVLPQRPFQTKRLTWSSAVSAFFTIGELKIGQETMFVQTGDVPAEIFSQTGVGVSLLGYIAKPGVTITMRVTNIDSDGQFIRAAIIGAAVV
jgi:hypothetical protein